MNKKIFDPRLVEIPATSQIVDKITDESITLPRIHFGNSLGNNVVQETEFHFLGLRGNS